MRGSEDDSKRKMLRDSDQGRSLTYFVENSVCRSGLKIRRL